MGNMFDLTEELSLDRDKKKAPRSSTSVQTQKNGTTLFFSDTTCRDVVLEAYNFEGIDVPTCIKGTPQPTKKYQYGELVLVQLTESTDIEKDALQLNALIPNDRVVIILGNTDSIFTLRKLEKIGFYYLPWPADKMELLECISLARANDYKREQHGYFRQAKRIAIVGTKGGIGTTAIAAELTILLAKQSSRSVLVDHHYTFSNLDIILSNKELKQVNVNSITVDPKQLDEESINSYLTEIGHNTYYLGFTGADSLNELERYTHIVSTKLNRQTNFIIHDFSGSLNFPLTADSLVNEHDVIILVTEPSVSCTRATQHWLDKLKDAVIQQLASPKIMVVLNTHRPASSFNLSQSEVERFLKVKCDVVIPFYKSAAKQLIDGNKLQHLETRKSAPFTQLAQMLTGKGTLRKKGLLNRLLLNRGKI
ncbi:AAA family ATPase [Vibrio mediterranei]